MRVIGLDVGFGYTKALGETKSVVFPSVISPAVELPYKSGFEDLSDWLAHLAVTLYGAPYFVGELARRQGRFAHATLDRVRTQGQEYRLLFLTALALLCESPGEEVSVVTGLPVDDYNDRHMIEDALSGHFRLTVAGRDIELIIRSLTVVPQPCGAFMDLLFKNTTGNMDPQFADAQVGIIDIGYKTTDFVLIRKGEFIQKLSGSLKKGMSLVYQAGIPLFTSRYPGNWDLRLVETALRDRTITSLGKRIEVDPLPLSSELSGLAKEIAAWVHSRWGGESVDFLICSGGGSLLIDPHIRKLFPQMIFLNEPQMANVRGFYKGAWYYYG